MCKSKFDRNNVNFQLTILAGVAFLNWCFFLNGYGNIKLRFHQHMSLGGKFYEFRKKYSILEKTKEDYTRAVSGDDVCFPSDNIQMGNR